MEAQHLGGQNQDDLLQKMEKLDKEILVVEHTKSDLQSRMKELLSSIETWKKIEKEQEQKQHEETIKKEEIKNEDPEVEYRRRLIERFSYKNTENIRRIYKENRKRAEASHHSLYHLNYKGENLQLPLYNQPSDLVSYHENIEKFKAFKPRLVKFLQMKRLAEIKMEKHLKEEYQTREEAWLKRIEKIENNPRRKQRQQRSRQFYEREFPEIKKQREHQERMDRIGSRSVGFIRSEAEVDEIADNLRELDASEKQMQLLAVRPPYLLSKYERTIKYINNNGLIRNLDQFEKIRKAGIIWSEEEKQIFREKFAQFPKDFEKIASFLKMKNCSDCVLFYYQNKKKEYFKSSKLKKKKGKASTRTGGISMNQSKKQNKQPQGKESVEVEVEDEDDDEDDDGASDEENQPALMDTATSVETKVTKSDVDVRPTQNKQCSSNPAPPSVTMETEKIIKTTKAVPLPPVKVFNTRSGKFSSKTVTAPITKTEPDVSTNETLAVSSAESPHPPLKITIVVTSPSNIGTSSATMSVGSIVSETVTAAAAAAAKVASEQTTTIVPSEPTIAVKVEELIKQHLTKMPEHSDPSRWSESEMMNAVEGLKRYGRHWQSISKLVETKSEAQCKNFYFNYKKKFNLESILGIARTKEKDETVEQEEDLISYLEELDRMEELEKKQQQDALEKQQKLEVKSAKTGRHRHSSKKIMQESSKVIIQTIDTEINQLPSTTQINISTQSFSVAGCSSTTQTSNTNQTDSKTTDGHVFSATSSEVVPFVTSREGTLRPPPPLVACSLPADTSVPPIKEISLRQDVGLFQKKLQFSLDKEKVLNVSLPLSNAESSSVISVSGETLPQSVTTSIHDLSMHARQYVAFSGHAEYPLTSQHINVSQASLPTQPFSQAPHPSQPFPVATPNRLAMEQTIKSFNTLSGCMSSLPPQVNSQPDLPSQRFRFQMSPDNIQARMPVPRNIPQPLPHIKHTSVPSSINIPQSRSPGFSQSMQSSLTSPTGQELFISRLNPHQLEEIKKRQELEYFHRQKQLEKEHDTPSLLRQEIEAERDAQLLFRKKEREFQILEAQFRQQEERKYMHLKKLEFDRRQEEVKHMQNLMEIDKQKEIEIQRRLFAEKMHEHGPMSQDMVLRLMNRYFPAAASINQRNEELRHFGSQEDLRKLQEFGSQEDLRNIRGFGSQENLHKLFHEKPLREQYLRQLPHQPKTRAEMQKRAVSIPDLRANLGVTSDKYIPEIIGHQRIRTTSGPSHKSVIPDDKHAEYMPRPEVNQPYHPVHGLGFDQLPKISLPDVPLEPLSRPGSAGSEVSDAAGIDRNLYGISTGLARKPPPLTSITGGGISVASPGPRLSNMRQVTTAFKTNLDTEPPRRKTIVRPWEIDTEVSKTKTPPPPLHGPVHSGLVRSSPNQSNPQPVIQLAATSNQFKEQIINMAQKNSPAPQMFPKFNFSEVPSDTRKVSTSSTTQRRNPSSSELSLSPTYPMPVRSNRTDAHIMVNSPFPEQNYSTRPRSDSEETISADESESREPTAIPPSSMISQVTALSSVPKSSLLMQRLKSNQKHHKENVSYKTEYKKTSDAPKQAFEGHSMVPQQVQVSDNLESVKEDSGDVRDLCKMNYCEMSENKHQSTIENNPANIMPLITTTLEYKNTNDSVVIAVSSSGHTSVVSHTMCDEKTTTKETVVPRMETNEPIVATVDIVVPRAYDMTEGNLSSTTEVITNPIPVENQVTDFGTLSPAKLILPSSTSTFSNQSKSESEETSSGAPKEFEVKGDISKMETNEKVMSKNKIMPPDASLSESVVKNSAPKPKRKERLDSPDIYDDLKVHNYDDHSQDSFDLYSDMKPKSNELQTLTATRNSPTSDVDLFYTTEERVADDDKQPEVLDGTAESSENTEISNLVASKDDHEDGGRSDASTPVMDEPTNVASVFIPIKPDTTSTLAPEQNILENTECSSAGSTPEAKTPLLDEPEYSFEPVQAGNLELNIDYMQFKNQSVLVPCESKQTENQGKPISQPQQEAFESITPPSSPESGSTGASSSVQVMTSTSQSSSAIAFPFSALAFSVGSRPSSRAGSGGHSPDDRGRLEQNSGGKNKSKRSRDDENKDVEIPSDAHFQPVDIKRALKRNYRRSGSQSSSSSFSKSPEYEYKGKKLTSSRSTGRSSSERHTEDVCRKQKRSLSPADFDAGHGKKQRTL
ncbi:uncharacterized protein LOC130612546 [Hydractinia symbiolongicarpus]|uniref:uncharacterized protein LOC130612546 n=1 Tax=Hydractinia symbiolongicarpus TaxID=13093 RepID=UPI00254C3207|nr:uncharacterized protein LOC130612546 [Hydractinia symbiolongicarpus]